MIFANIQMDYRSAPGALVVRQGGHEMKRKRIEAYCSCCGREQMFAGREINHWFHATLTVLSLGFWLPIYFAVLLMRFMRPWRCSVCEWHKPEFRKPYIGQMRYPAPEDE
jgi:hypothetical protein